MEPDAPGVRPYARGIVYSGFFIRLNNFPIFFSDSPTTIRNEYIPTIKRLYFPIAIRFGLPMEPDAPGVRPYARGIVYSGFFIRLNNFPICFSDSPTTIRNEHTPTIKRWYFPAFCFGLLTEPDVPPVRPHARGFVYSGFFIRLNNFPIFFSDSRRNRTATIKYFHFFSGSLEKIFYLCYVSNNSESNGDKL